MPRYFFNVREGETFRKDYEGVELPDLDAVREEALGGIKDVTAGNLRRGAGMEVLSGRFFDVTDESGRTVLTLPSKAPSRARALTPSPRPA